jgi:hypothetical protein
VGAGPRSPGSDSPDRRESGAALLEIAHLGVEFCQPEGTVIAAKDVCL